MLTWDASQDACELDRKSFDTLDHQAVVPTATTSQRRCISKCDGLQSERIIIFKTRLQPTNVDDTTAKKPRCMPLPYELRVSQIAIVTASAATYALSFFMSFISYLWQILKDRRWTLQRTSTLYIYICIYICIHNIYMYILKHSCKETAVTISTSVFLHLYRHFLHWMSNCSRRRKKILQNFG